MFILFCFDPAIFFSLFFFSIYSFVEFGVGRGVSVLIVGISHGDGKIS